MTIWALVEGHCIEVCVVVRVLLPRLHIVHIAVGGVEVVGEELVYIEVEGDLDAIN